MADFTMRIADEDVDRVIVALCGSELMEVSYENALAVVMKFITNTVQSKESYEAKQVALDSIVLPPPVQLSKPEELVDEPAAK